MWIIAKPDIAPPGYTHLQDIICPVCSERFRLWTVLHYARIGDDVGLFSQKLREGCQAGHPDVLNIHERPPR